MPQFTSNSLFYVLLVGAGFFKLAHADFYVFTDTQNLSQISGYNGDQERINIGVYDDYRDWRTSSEPVGKANAGIVAITWGEKGDKPCSMELIPSALNADMENGLIDPRGPFDKKKNFCKNDNDGNFKTADTLGFVNGISVCTTDKNDSSKDRLKGIEIYAATLSKREPHVRNVEAEPEKSEHRHCANWHSPVMCPEGFIASGVKIYRHPQEGFFRGMSLKCRKVAISQSPYEMVPVLEPKARIGTSIPRVLRPQ